MSSDADANKARPGNDSPLALGETPRGRSGSGQEEVDEEDLDVSTPVSYFDDYRASLAASPPPPPNLAAVVAAAVTAKKLKDGGEEDASALRDKQEAGEVASSDANRPRPGSSAVAHVRINMATTIIQSMNEEDDDDEEDEEDDNSKKEEQGSNDKLGNPLALPRHPNGKKRFRITFKNVKSPEKLPPGQAQPQKPPRPAPPVPPARPIHKAIPSAQRRVEEEGLGDDWATKPWKEPSVDIARNRARRALVAQGRMKLWKTSPEDLLFLGPGIALYFSFVKIVAIFCFFSSLLHIPHIIVSYAGGVLRPYKITPSSASYSMAANHMITYPGAIDVDNTTRWCEGDTVDTMFARNVPCTEPMFHLYGRNSKVYIKAAHASYLISACDLVSCLLFIATWFWLIYKHAALKKADAMSPVLSATDYAVHVQGLPPDATEEEIVAHFNRLYAINGAEEDWTYEGDACGLINVKTYKRGPESILDATGKIIGPSLQPVEEPLPAHEQQLIYKKSWLAEVVVAHPMGSLIRRFRTLEKLSQQLLLQRAIAKKYNSNTTFKGGKGANKEKFIKAKARLVVIQDEIDAEKIRLKALADTLVKMERMCVGAYVIFEHRRSRDRALRDYQLYSNHRLLCWKPPPPLLFRKQHRLILTEPPPPSDVVWEALEAKPITRALRRIVTNSVTLFLLLCVVFITVSLSSLSNRYALGADLEVCETLGLNVYGAANLAVAATESSGGASSLWYHFSPGNDYCPASDHYLSRLSPQQAFEAVADPCSQPCFNLNDEMALKVPQTCPGGASLPRRDIIKCFCYDAMGGISSSSSSSSSAASTTLHLSDICRAPASEFMASMIISAVASVVINVTNEVIRFVLPMLVDWELHSSLSDSVVTLYMRSLATLFLNTVGLLLLVHLRVDNKTWNKFGFFTGTALDFDLSWYLNVGVGLSNTMFINAFTSQLPFLASELVIKPFSRYVQSTVSKVSQISMNKVWAPSKFRIHTRLAMLANTLIITLLFNSALPALMPFCFVAFTFAYCVDKFLLLRCCAKPPTYDGRLVRSSIDMMPCLLALHTFLAIIILGNTDFFPSGRWLRNGLEKMDAADLKSTRTTTRMMQRLFLSSTLPLLILLTLLVLGKSAQFVSMDILSIVRFVKRACAPYTRACCKGQHDDEMEMNVVADAVEVGGGGEKGGKDGAVAVDGATAAKTKAHTSKRRTNKPRRFDNYPPYTRRFELTYPDKASIPEFAIESGWEIQEEGEERRKSVVWSSAVSFLSPPPPLHCVKLTKRWLEGELSASTAPSYLSKTGRGFYKKTWEVVEEGGLATYRIEDNKHYEEVLLVRSMLHLTAKSLLGLETSRAAEEEQREQDAALTALFSHRDFRAYYDDEEQEKEEGGGGEGGGGGGEQGQGKKKKTLFLGGGFGGAKKKAPIGS